MEELGNDEIKKNTYKLRPIIIWGCLLLLAFIVETMGLPMQNILLVVSTGGLLGYIVHAMINTKGRIAIINAILGLEILWLIALICFNLFNDGHPLNYRALSIFLGIGLVWFCGYRIAHWIRGSKKKARNQPAN